MKIESPLSRVEETEKLIEAGANELYCGVCPPDWKNKYAIIGCTNRNEHSLGNLSNAHELKQVVDIAKSHNVPVFVTMNALYTEKQHSHLMKLTNEILAVDIDALIITDLPYLLQLNKLDSGIKIHLSTGGTAFNSETIDFYKDLGVSRIVLPRQLTIEEIGDIAKRSKGIELAAFVFYGIDANIDGFCTFHHGLREHNSIGDAPLAIRDNPILSKLVRYTPNIIAKNIKKTKLASNLPACWLEYDVKVKTNNLDAKMIRDRISNSYSFNYMVQEACGICALSEFKKFGINSVKIVGRDNATHDKIKHVSFLHQALSLLDKNKSQNDFIKDSQELYRTTFKADCKIPRCYYPHALIKN